MQPFARAVQNLNDGKYKFLNNHFVIRKKSYFRINKNRKHKDNKSTKIWNYGTLPYWNAPEVHSR